MSKIVYVHSDKIGVGCNDGSLIEVQRDEINFTPNVDDEVEIFRNEGKIFIAKKSTDSTPLNRQPLPQITYKNPDGKSKMAAGLFGIFLGGLGVHSFYLGKIGIGVLQIIVTIFTCGIGSLWGFIEGIVILCSKPGSAYHKDANGCELDD